MTIRLNSLVLRLLKLRIKKHLKALEFYFPEPLCSFFSTDFLCCLPSHWCNLTLGPPLSPICSFFCQDLKGHQVDHLKRVLPLSPICPFFRQDLKGHQVDHLMRFLPLALTFFFPAAKSQTYSLLIFCWRLMVFQTNVL